MQTPAGKECQYFYGDYFRGRNHEECRLLESSPHPQTWSQELCFTCPVPDILLANACPHLTLEAGVERPFPYIKRQIRISARCRKTERDVPEPKIGCGECHVLPQIFEGETGDTDATARS